MVTAARERERERGRKRRTQGSRARRESIVVFVVEKVMFRTWSGLIKRSSSNGSASGSGSATSACGEAAAALDSAVIWTPTTLFLVGPLGFDGAAAHDGRGNGISGGWSGQNRLSLVEGWIRSRPKWSPGDATAVYSGQETGLR
jgi:hypothetical protein